MCVGGGGRRGLKEEDGGGGVLRRQEPSRKKRYKSRDCTSIRAKMTEYCEVCHVEMTQKEVTISPQNSIYIHTNTNSIFSPISIFPIFFSSLSSILFSKFLSYSFYCGFSHSFTCHGLSSASPQVLANCGFSRGNIEVLSGELHRMSGPRGAWVSVTELT